MAGYQRNRLFRNNADGTFTEIGFLAGVDSLADGYIAATADLNKDGKMDLVLRNADPGSEGYSFPTVQAFLNETPVENRSLELKLVGSKSNRDGIGAKVTATIAGKKVVRDLIANNGSAQSERLVHFGLGAAKEVSKLAVQWPSGSRSELLNVKPGVLTIHEQLNIQRAEQKPKQKRISKK